MGVDPEANFGGYPMQSSVEVGFRTGVEGEIDDVTALRADEVVVVVPGEMFGELVAGEVVAGHDAGDDVGLFESGQVSVDRGLWKRVVGGDDLGDGEGPVAGLQGGNEASATAGVALVGTLEEGGGLIVDFVIGH